MICDHCDEPINVTADPHCRCVNPYDSRDVSIVCEGCRERAYERQQERLMEDGPGPSLLEQQREAMKLK